MNLYECIQATEEYIKQLKKYDDNAEEIHGANLLHKYLKEAQTLYPDVGMDAFYPNKNFINRDKAQAFHDKLVKAKELADRLLKDGRRGNLTLGNLHRYKDKLALEPINAALQSYLHKLKDIKENWNLIAKNSAKTLKKYSTNILFLMSQGFIPAQERGECYGLVMEYASHGSEDLPEKPFYFSPEASDMQNNQLLKNYEKRKWYTKRLGIIEYHPDVSRQAETLGSYADQNQGEHLLIGLALFSGKHAVYLQKTPENKWHYFDPNHGAFLFDSKQEFKDFYTDLYSEGSYKYNHWHSLSVEKLTKQPQENTWGGKLRSFLTGPNHKNGHLINGGLAKTLIIGSALLVGIAAAAAIILFCPPLTLPLLGIVGGIGLKILLGVATGLALGTIVNNIGVTLYNFGFRGLLAIPRIIDFGIRRIFNSLPKREDMQEELENPDSLLSKESEKKDYGNSTNTILNLLPPRESFKKTSNDIGIEEEVDTLNNENSVFSDDDLEIVPEIRYQVLR